MKIWCNIIMVLDRLPSGRQTDGRTDERTYRYQMMLMFLFGWLRWLAVCPSVYLPWKCHHVILVLFNSNCTIEVEEYVPPCGVKLLCCVMFPFIRSFSVQNLNCLNVLAWMESSHPSIHSIWTAGITRLPLFFVRMTQQ